MESLILRSSRSHLVSNEVQPLVLESRSNKCSSPRSLVVCGQQRDVQCSCKAISKSLLLKSITNRRHESSKHFALNTIQHAILSTKRTLRKQSRIIRNGLASDTGSDSEAKTGRHPGWSMSDKLRYDFFVHFL